jgi:serralysin
MPTTAYVFNEGAITNEYLQGLVGGSAWNNANPITYYLAFSDFNSNGTNDWLEDGAGDAIRLAFQLWENVADITFTEVFTLAEANLVESITDAGGGLGFHQFPDPADDVSNGEYNQNGTGWNATGLVQGGYGFITIIHELGHALGVEHPHDTDIFPGIPTTSPTDNDSSATGTFNLNQGVYTTMSYNDGWATGLYTTTNDFGWQGTPMALDIAAIQLMYGANMTYQTGNDTYALSDSNGAGTFYSAIWDAGGTDEITYGGASRAFIFLGEATIDGSLTGGGLISFVEGIQGGYTIAQNAVIENASGGGGNDLLDGNDTSNTLQGNAGDDTLIGRLGSDVLIGGVGNDLLIGDFDGLSNLLTVDPTLGGGITLGSGSITAGVGSNNATLGTAIDISGQFSLASNANIVDSTTTPHVTIFGTGEGARDYYSFTVNNPHATIRVDMDNTSGTYDSMVAIVDSSGNIMRLSDDSVASVGGAGSVADFGTVARSGDGYLEWTPFAAGTYYIVVGAYSGLDVIPSGATYELQVSIDNELGGASPYAAFFPYFDFNATGGASDTLNGGDGDDRAYGGEGNDVVDGGNGDDWLSGGNGDDTVIGQAGIDQLFGDAGNDRLFGGAGADVINGGADDDAMIGGDERSLSVNEATIFRVFGATLNRAPDIPGLQNWVNELESGAQTLEQIVTGFVQSTEFQATYGSLTDSEFVTLLYQNVLDRAPDQAGLDAYIAALGSGSLSREQVVLEFSESTEYQNSSLFESQGWATGVLDGNNFGGVFRIYGATLDRLPDIGGFAAWVGELDADNLTLTQVAEQFISRTEFQATYGSLTDTDFVTLLYNNVLNRAPDAAGLQSWLDALASGSSRADVVLGFSESAEYRGNTALDLTVFVQANYADQIDTIYGGAGINVLLGGRGADVFVFDANDQSTDTVLGLEGVDSIQFQNFGYTDLNDALADMSVVGQSVVLIQGNTTITFLDATLQQATEALSNADSLFG